MQPDTIKTAQENILQIRDLHTYFYTREGIVHAVEGVDLKLGQGEVLGLVGESGCGKSVTALSILRLVSMPGKIVQGSILFNGVEILKLSTSEMVRIRGNQISMIFQQPQSSLNPVQTIGDQITEVFTIHQKISRKEARERALELLKIVGIPDPKRKAVAYPHEMSGGQAQRVMIAMALALRPQLLIADEPTTALDVTIQAQILDLFLDLRAQMATSMILITHDLAVVAEMADRVAVMYAGKVIEEASVRGLLINPMHPYTQGLIESMPRLGHIKERLSEIPGSVPNLIDMADGCKFVSRCQKSIQHNLTKCKVLEPPLVEVENGHFTRCWLYQESGN